jgi:hypothetical protein
MSGKYNVESFAKEASVFGITHGFQQDRLGWFVTCGCGSTQGFGLATNTPSNKVISIVRSQGWAIAKKKTPICPACQKGNHEVASPTGPDPKLARKIFAALDDHFDEKRRLYSPGWTDAKIAEALSVSLAIVTSIRKSAYGELAEDPHITAFKDEIELLKMEFSDSFAKLSSEFTARLARLEASIPRPPTTLAAR